MFPSLFTNNSTYSRYKQDTDVIATWLATTAISFGYSADLLHEGEKPTVPPKSQRLKGKARKLAKEANARSNTSDTAAASSLLPRYAIGIKDFVTLAEYLALKSSLEIPTGIWAAIERSILLRRLHHDNHVFRDVDLSQMKSTERHFHFLGVLEKVRDVLKPLVPTKNPTQTEVGIPSDNGSRFENMFATLNVEEPSEEFLKAPDAKSSISKVENADSVYEVEPLEDPVELYLGTAALLQDLLAIRDTIMQIWQSFSQRGTSLSSAAVTTNIGIQLVQQLEQQFLKDYPAQKDTSAARNKFFGVQCFLQGQDPAGRVRPSDPINLSFYNLVEVSLLNTYILVESFGDVLGKTDLPSYKPGFFGQFDPTKDRTQMSGPQKFDEDKIVFLEILSDIVFFDYINREEGFTGADEFTKAVGLFNKNRHHTLTLDFASQIHLGLRQVLRGKPEMAWSDLQTYAFNSRGSLEQNMAFHQNLKIAKWPKQNDLILKDIMNHITTWFEKNIFHDQKSKILMEQGFTPDPNTIPHSFFKSHPLLCGSMLFGLKLDMQEVAVNFLNAWSSVKFAAQIYNAVRKEKFLEQNWPDMDLAMGFYGQSSLFVGSAPSNVDEYFRRFCISVGYSAQNFAQNRRANTEPIVSKNGPQGVIMVETVAPMANEFRLEYCAMVDPSGKSAPKLESVIQKCVELVDKSNDADAPSQQPKRKLRAQKAYDASEALLLICQCLMDEEAALTFDHFHLHRSSWGVLRAVRDANDSDFKRIYGHMYLEQENQLPFVAGYLFMTAIRTKKLGNMLLPKKEAIVSSKALVQASITLKGMLEGGMGALEIKILRDQYGIEIEIE